MMSLAKLKTKYINNVRKRLYLLAPLCALGFSLALTAPAKAAFIGDYALNRFTLINANADGTVLSPDGGLSIILTGGNNGSGLPGMTDFVASATGAGTVQFNYSYSSLDTPQSDFAGFLLGGVFSQLADTDGQSGSAMFTVTSGQSFGFRVATVDNTSEPGILTISAFSAPSGTGATVPEPGTGSLMLGMAGAVAIQRYRAQRNTSLKRERIA